jgi:hypothetical protein
MKTIMVKSFILLLLMNFILLIVVSSIFDSSKEQSIISDQPRIKEEPYIENPHETNRPSLSTISPNSKQNQSILDQDIPHQTPNDFSSSLNISSDQHPSISQPTTYIPSINPTTTISESASSSRSTSRTSSETKTDTIKVQQIIFK